MSTPHAQGRGLGDELTNALMIALVAVFGVAVVLREAGSIAAFLTGAAQPDVGIAGGRGKGILFRKGEVVGSVTGSLHDLENALMHEIDLFLEQRRVRG